MSSVPAEVSHADGASTTLLLKVAVVVTFALLGLRLNLAAGAGATDLEALYLGYGLHVQPLYTTGPGLIGWLASQMPWVRGVPSAQGAHFFTAVAATVVPWLGGWVTRQVGGTRRDALWAVIATSALPTASFGLFFFSPALPLAVFWLLSVGFALGGRRQPMGTVRSFVFTVCAAASAGLALMSHPVALALVVGMLVMWVSPKQRPKWRTLEPYAGVAVLLAFVSPVLAGDVRYGGLSMASAWLPSVRVDSFLGWMFAGQLVVVGPVALGTLGWLLWRGMAEPGFLSSRRVLFTITVTALLLGPVFTRGRLLGTMNLWLPAYLTIVPLVCVSRIVQDTRTGRTLGLWSIATSGLLTAALLFSFMSPKVAKFLVPNEVVRVQTVDLLRAWAGPGRELRQDVTQLRLSGIHHMAVVGATEGLCAQAQLAVGNLAPVGCDVGQSDDFSRWYPSARWQGATVIIYVLDDSTVVDIAKRFPKRTVRQVRRVKVNGSARQRSRTIRFEHLGLDGAV